LIQTEFLTRHDIINIDELMINMNDVY